MHRSYHMKEPASRNWPVQLEGRAWLRKKWGERVWAKAKGLVNEILKFYLKSNRNLLKCCKFWGVSYNPIYIKETTLAAERIMDDGTSTEAERPVRRFTSEAKWGMIAAVYRRLREG